MLPDGVLRLMREFPEPVLLVSTAGEVLASNNKAARLLGVAGRPAPAALQEFLSEPADRLLGYLRVCARTNESTPGAFSLNSSPGARCRFEGSGMSLGQGVARCVWLRILPRELANSPFLALNERIAQLVSEVHARTRAEAALRAQTAQFQTLLNESPLCIYLVDSDLRIRQMNPRAAADFGIPITVGRSLIEILQSGLPQPVVEEIIHRFQRTLETGEPHIVHETIDARAGGGEIPKYYTWQVHRIPLLGEGFGLVCYFQDISARKQVEDAMRKAEKLAAVGRLAASIAHEINNPLEAVTNLLYLARQDANLASKTSKYLVQADSELDRVAHLARQTLGFYRDSVAPVSFVPADLVESVIDMYCHRLNSRKVQLVKDLRRTSPVYGFAGEFRQVLSNLIVNALDAINIDGGLLILRTRPSRRRNREGVRITIADNGSGITADRVKKIFEAFYTTKKDVGTGLGLWLSQEIVQKHEGSIRVKSRTSRPCGTAFSIFWPCKPLLFSQPMHPIPAAPSTDTLPIQ